jgi:hypothetical protein
MHIRRVWIRCGAGLVDAKRLALTGGSYAGYMAAWMIMTTLPAGNAACTACRFLYGTSDAPPIEQFVRGPMDFESLAVVAPGLRHIRTGVEHQETIGVARPRRPNSCTPPSNASNGRWSLSVTRARAMRCPALANPSTAWIG